MGLGEKGNHIYSLSQFGHVWFNQTELTNFTPYYFLGLLREDLAF